MGPTNTFREKPDSRPLLRQRVAPAWREPSCDRRHGSADIASDLRGRSEAVALDQPLLVVLTPKLPQRLDQLRDGGKRIHPEQVLYAGAYEPLGDAISFGRSRAVVSSEPSPATPPLMNSMAINGRPSPVRGVRSLPPAPPAPPLQSIAVAVGLRIDVLIYVYPFGDTRIATWSLRGWQIRVVFNGLRIRYGKVAAGRGYLRWPIRPDFLTGKHPMPSSYRISRKRHKPVVDVAQVDAIEPALRTSKPGVYHIDEISIDPLPRGHTSRRWGVGIRRPNGSVAIEPDPWSENAG